MDTHGVERVDFNALGGADAVAVNNLTGTDVKSVPTSTSPAPSAAPRVTARPTRSSSTAPRPERCDRPSPATPRRHGVRPPLAGRNAASGARPTSNSSRASAATGQTSPPPVLRPARSPSSSTAEMWEPTRSAGCGGTATLLGGNGEDAINSNMPEQRQRGPRRHSRHIVSRPATANEKSRANGPGQGHDGVQERRWRRGTVSTCSANGNQLRLFRNPRAPSRWTRAEYDQWVVSTRWAAPRQRDGQRPDRHRRHECLTSTSPALSAAPPVTASSTTSWSTGSRYPTTPSLSQARCQQRCNIDAPVPRRSSFCTPEATDQLNSETFLRDRHARHGRTRRGRGCRAVLRRRPRSVGRLKRKRLRGPPLGGPAAPGLCRCQ